jgi:hypothetical protein
MYILHVVLHFTEVKPLKRSIFSEDLLVYIILGLLNKWRWCRSCVTNFASAILLLSVVEDLKNKSMYSITLVSCRNSSPSD